MAQGPIESIEIFMYQGREVRISCLVYPWGDATQLDNFEIAREAGKRKKTKVERYHAGSMWRTNKDLARTSKGKTERQHYPSGAYSLLRSGIEAVNNYGLIKFAPDTEISEIEDHKLKVRRAAIEIMTNGGSVVELETLAKQHNEPLIRELDTKRNIRKKMAQQNLRRGTVAIDSRGRRNPRVMAAVTEAAIGNLNWRIESMWSIASRLDTRSRGVTSIIRQRRALYRQVRLQFDPHCEAVWKAEDAGTRPKNVQIQPGWLDELSGLPEHEAMYETLRHFRNAFELVKEAPFCKNARHMAEDCKRAMWAIEEQQDVHLYNALKRILEGTRWFFALDHLEQRVIFPLALLMADLRRRERARRRVTHEKGKFKITRNLAPYEFGMIAHAFSSFVKELAWEKDGELMPEAIANPMRPRIKPLLKTVFAAMREDDWIKVKRNLLKIEAIL
ncbi:MAG: hypothetical protein PHS79_05460 [Patescibacteria group bacterium]|nr:hypothetical protein [Patescibacteria group bacterium]